MRASSLAIVLALALVLPASPRAEENNDLDLIPKTIDSGTDQSQPAPAAPSAGTRRGRYYVEDVAGLSSLRRLLVPVPGPQESWQNRTSLDALDEWDLGARITLTLSDRFSLREASDIDPGQRRSVRNDLREAYVTWEPAEARFLELGRVNVRHGVALGFNPTDFFRARSAVDQASIDPSSVRQNRLGAMLARGQAIWSGGAASLALSPRLEDPSTLQASRPGLDPRFDRTNAADRALFTLGVDFADLSPEALVYRESGLTRFGLNLSRQVGQSVVLYGEWAGGDQQSLIAEAITDGKRTGAIPGAAPMLPPSATGRRFQNDLALGGSFASALGFTLNLEYHLHEAGFSADDWRRWFQIGGAPNASRSAAELWYIRGYANDRQVPTTRHQAFIRLNAVDAFRPGLELTGLAFVDLYDGSSLMQLQALYHLSNAWTLGAYVSTNIGGLRSERGSFGQAASAVFQVVRYF